MEPSPSAGARKPVFPAEVIEALEQGHKIDAIRRMREKTGLGLKESKDAVEAYAHSHDLSGPARAPLSPGEVRRSPRARLVWGIVLVVGCAIYFIFRKLA
jgi:hypothetical protein